MLQDILFDEWSGHDSQIESIFIDPVAETVTISLLSYPIDRTQDRIPIKILFKEVTSVNTITDNKRLTDNRGAGNVSSWHISPTAGNSSIVLAGGYISITSRVVPVVVEGQ